MQIGDWVRSYSKGIWRVYRVLSGFYEPRYSLAEPKALSPKVLVFSQRLVNNRWKKSFSSECCEASLVRLLNPAERAQLDSFISTNQPLFEAFERSAPKPVDLVLNLAFSLPSALSKNEFALKCGQLFSDPLAAGVTSDQIITVLEQDQIGSFRGKYPIKATLQFSCRDHEIVEREFIYRAMRVLPF